ncbi:proton-coupled zinc antiporter SLC30A1-like [Rhinoraja longicauda]
MRQRGHRSCWGAVSLHLMFALTLGVWLLQLSASKVCCSLALLSQSFHTFSTLLGLSTLQVSLRLNRVNPPTRAKNTFGWLRVEPLGALVQGVFLAGLCLTALGKAVESVLQPRPVRRPGVLVGVGLTSLLVDLGSLYIFRGGTNNAHDWHSADSDCKRENKELLSEMVTGVPERSKSWRGEDLEEPGVMGEELRLDCQRSSPRVLGDALVSVLLLLNALAHYTAWPSCSVGQCKGEERAGPCWLLYLDPALVLVVVSRALWVSWPRLKESALLLLQAVPGGLDVRRLRERLLRQDGVEAVHELHVWRLAGRRLVATAHARCREAGTAGRLAALLRREGMVAVAVQPEVGPDRGLGCELACGQRCAPRLCCAGDRQPSRPTSLLAEAPLSAYSTECESTV